MPRTSLSECSKAAKNRDEGGSRLVAKVAGPLDGLLVLTTQMLTTPCHLFVFGQGCGYWWTCRGESICFAEAILLDLRMVWTWGPLEKDVKNAMPFAENSAQFMGECAGSRVFWAIITLRDERSVLKYAVPLLLFVFCTWNSPNFE